ncbi:histidinol-phosphatase (PHP family) [Brevibacillus sp. 1238]|nr:histidinol-phosphatase (PHP family) [Brevibacillus sp. 1238]
MQNVSAFFMKLDVTVLLYPDRKVPDKRLAAWEERHRAFIHIPAVSRIQTVENGWTNRRGDGMKVDFHVHLEEGPYSLDWLVGQACALRPLLDEKEESGSRGWAHELVKGLAHRLQRGPYSREWLDLYRARAKQAGISQVCVVEHLYRFADFRPYYEQFIHVGHDRLGKAQRQWLGQMANDSLPAYVAFLAEERERWAEDGVALRIGIELDYFPGGEGELREVIEKYPWDVCMGAVHFPGGKGYLVRNLQEQLEVHASPGWFVRYFDVVEQAIDSGLFDVLTHLDGVRAFDPKADEMTLLPYYQRIARALRRMDTATELNTACVRGQTQREFSPSYRFLQILAQHEVPITLSSHATAPDQVGQHLAEARMQLRRAGYASLAVFADRKRSLMEIE